MSLTYNSPVSLNSLLDDNSYLVTLIAEITDQPVSLVQQRLEDEKVSPGINVERDFKNWRLIPHVWNNEMSQFYSHSDAFLYELIVWNRNPIKRKSRDWIIEYLARESSSDLAILCLGDGLGFDSLYLAQSGHRVTFFELPGYCEAFARRIIKDSGYPVCIINDESEIPKETYDVVVCLDVLEHVPDPASFVASVVSYLRPGGRAIIHAPFYLVSNRYLTHLKSNQKYSGSLSLFTRQNLVLIDGNITWNPIVFRKLDEDIPCSNKFNWHLFYLRLMGLLFTVGRFWTTPFSYL